MCTEVIHISSDARSSGSDKKLPSGAGLCPRCRGTEDTPSTVCRKKPQEEGDLRINMCVWHEYERAVYGTFRASAFTWIPIGYKLQSVPHFLREYYGSKVATTHSKTTKYTTSTDFGWSAMNLRKGSSLSNKDS
ncbi:hypothetical protein ACRALDRAFT_213307 [Sodiomyces alcalophilus JCM 7366]|uniref:uncharacterized protein n=1 Tax=Sodiomyces alcalophilus JCM 7366 TaxID=591952 RepID=UPI0039B475A5